VRFVPVTRATRVVAFALVDNEDYAAVTKWRWSLNGSGYAYGSPGLMHRLLLGLAKRDGKEVHHVNRFKLDNRRSNLVLTTHAENCRIRGRRRASWPEIPEFDLALMIAQVAA
jgi:hypothetical protein